MKVDRAPIDADLALKYRWPNSGTWVRLNMAITVDGSSVGENGTSSGVSFAQDRALLNVIRSAADAVVVGAETIRKEGWNLPRVGLLIVLTRSQQLPWDTCPDRSRVRVYTDISSVDNLVDALETLHLSRILVEGGRHIARMFAISHRLDEICLTVSASGLPTDREVEDARVSLLGMDDSHFERVFIVRAAETSSVFALWRRALSARPAGGSSLQT